MTTALHARFDRAVFAVGGHGVTRALFDELVARYAEPHRRYHTLEHIEACLGWLDRFHDVAERAAEVELALWFHDAIYVIGSRENERQSAALARHSLRGLSVDDAVIERIATHIEATEAHATTTGDTALLVDIDLSILGSRPEVFGRFERDIRAEYASVPEPAFCAGRRKVLERFAAKPRIYETTALRDALEDAARANLKRRIAELSS